MMKYLLLSVVVFAFVACDKGAKTPEGLIKMYVKDMTTKKLDKAYFEENTTGKLWDSIKDLEETEFEKFISSEKIKNAKVSIKSKSCQSDECSVTYIVKYDVFVNGKKSFETEVKKIASTKQIGDKWKMADVSNVKTYMESTEPINALEE